MPVGPIWHGPRRLRIPPAYRRLLAHAGEIAAEGLDLTREPVNGIEHLGVAPADVLTRARTALHERKAQGLHAGMEFTYRNPALRYRIRHVRSPAGALISH